MIAYLVLETSEGKATSISNTLSLVTPNYK